MLCLYWNVNKKVTILHCTKPQTTWNMVTSICENKKSKQLLANQPLTKYYLLSGNAHFQQYADVWLIHMSKPA
jgi:hypothetical protein